MVEPSSPMTPLGVWSGVHAIFTRRHRLRRFRWGDQRPYEYVPERHLHSDCQSRGRAAISVPIVGCANLRWRPDHHAHFDDKRLFAWRTLWKLCSALRRTNSRERYEMVVGLEVHVQLKTRTKAFCGCPTDFGAAPNVNTCPAMSGPARGAAVLNERLSTGNESSARARVQSQSVSIFRARNYFYPTCRKAIRSLSSIAARDGWTVVIGKNEKGSDVQIGITRLHMEEDAANRFTTVIPARPPFTSIRWRSIIEIVSEPDIRTSAGAGATSEH